MGSIAKEGMEFGQPSVQTIGNNRRRPKATVSQASVDWRLSSPQTSSQYASNLSKSTKQWRSMKLSEAQVSPRQRGRNPRRGPPRLRDFEERDAGVFDL